MLDQISICMYFDLHIEFLNMENKHVSEELADWQQVQSPFSTFPAKLIDENDNSSVIKNNFFSGSSVFPPGNHEDLPISNPEYNHQHLQEPVPIHTTLPQVGGDSIRKSRRLHLGTMRTWIFWIVGGFRNYVNCKDRFWSFAWVAGGVAAAVLVSFLRRRVWIWWQRRMKLDGCQESLMALIREKDETIKQLLLQIAQMNEMLLARRRVPVIRAK